MNKLFTVAFAAMALAACSNDDDMTANNQGGNGETELVDAISISFGNGNKTNTRVMSSAGTVGVGTENDIYEAFVFAKEANPKHTRPKDGDWTVIRVVADNDGKVLTETGGVVPDAPATLPDKGSLTVALNNLGGDKDWKVEKVATFSGVRQGDYVYVIANDPNLTLAEATVMAHQGIDSEDKIKEYVAALSKDYLNGLGYYPESGTASAPALPKGHYVMAGREVVPATPTLPSNGALTVTVGLDRELAKVDFKATVTLNTADAACGKVEFQKGDGVLVARIARSVSMFTQQPNEWYVPSHNNVVNWPADGATPETSVLFDGTSATDIADWVPGVDAPANFNKLAPAGSVTEYRYSWVLKEGSMEDKSRIYLSQGTLYPPVFYVSPNYSGNTNAVTVIVTQATYIGHNTLVPAVTQEMLTAALGDNTFNPSGPGHITEIGEDFWNTEDNVSKMYTFLTKTGGTYADLFPAADYPDAGSLLDYTTNMKLYYRADVADYVGGVSTKLTERNVLYDTKGTIQSLGAKTITDAIMSEDNAMNVDVTVNKWKLSINEVPM